MTCSGDIEVVVCGDTACNVCLHLRCAVTTFTPSLNYNSYQNKLQSNLHFRYKMYPCQFLLGAVHSDTRQTFAKSQRGFLVEILETLESHSSLRLALYQLLFQSQYQYLFIEISRHGSPISSARPKRGHGTIVSPVSVSPCLGSTEVSVSTVATARYLPLLSIL